MLPPALPVLHAFFAVRYFVSHITQKAKPAFPPLRWPALVVRAYAFSFLLPVSRTGSGESRQNDGGFVYQQGIADFYRRAKARCVVTAG